jgi:hypothetical protein
LDDIRLTSDLRINANKIQINKNEIIKWSLFIKNLRVNDSRMYICQLNVKPYDSTWLNRFKLNVYAPATFIDDDNDDDEHHNKAEFKKNNFKYQINGFDNSIYVKTVKENHDLILKCNAQGTPTPSVSWYLKYPNGTLTSKLQFHALKV